MSERGSSSSPVGSEWFVFHSREVAQGDTRAMLAIALSYGEPSTRDGPELWPIRPISAAGTFSQTASEATLHTDAQYHDVPESRFLLFCVRAARCGGGLSRLLRLSDIATDLERELGQNDTALLRKSLWSWETPSVFGGDQDELASPHPVVQEEAIRWRYDNLVIEPPLRETARRFHRYVENHPAVTSLPLGPGDVLYCDNRRVLHGRTQFDDPNRLLYRVRLW